MSFEILSDFHFPQFFSEIGSQPSRIPTPPPHKTFDFGSEEDDNESITVENSWRGDDDSDDDSVDSEMENPLKYAGAYSAEEVIRIMRDKLIRLQKLYIDQFQRLQYLLKEERRQYRMALRKVIILHFRLIFQLNDELNFASFNNEDLIFITHPF